MLQSQHALRRLHEDAFFRGRERGEAAAAAAAEGVNDGEEKAKQPPNGKYCHGYVGDRAADVPRWEEQPSSSRANGFVEHGRRRGANSVGQEEEDARDSLDAQIQGGGWEGYLIPMDAAAMCPTNQRYKEQRLPTTPASTVQCTRCAADVLTCSYDAGVASAACADCASNACTSSSGDIDCTLKMKSAISSSAQTDGVHVWEDITQGSWKEEDARVRRLREDAVQHGNAAEQGEFHHAPRRQLDSGACQDQRGSKSEQDSQGRVLHVLLESWRKRHPGGRAGVATRSDSGNSGPQRTGTEREDARHCHIATAAHEKESETRDNQATLNSRGRARRAHEGDGDGAGLCWHGGGRECERDAEEIEEWTHESLDLTEQVVDFVKIQTRFAESPHRIKVVTRGRDDPQPSS